MDHHGSHGGMDDMCSMAMLFHTDYQNLCIIFEWWHIRSLGSFLMSLVAIVLLGVGYEAVREISQRVELGYANPFALRHARSESQTRSNAAPKKSLRALLYASQVFYSFFVM